jgi:small-conductance mechanosensitive channel
LRIAVALVILSLFGWAAIAALRRRSERLAEALEQRERKADAERDAPEVHAPASESKQRRRFLAIALRSLEPERQLQLYRALTETGVWLLLFLWLGTLVWAFSLFPQTTPLSAAFLHGAIVVVSALIVTGLLNRLLDVVIARVASASRLRVGGRSEDRARRLLRIPTIASAIRGFKAFVLVFVAVLSVLGQIGVPIASVVTIGGLVAIALSFAAQSFVRDFVTGFLVLFEDHYVVGDYVGINAYSGLVERLTLRMVQIRDLSGDLITIPHSAVTSVVNMSRDWSRVDYRVPVDPASDVPKAVALVRDAVVEPIEWIGIDELSKDWAIVRASVRTAPLRQFELRREINARVEAAFRDGGITYGAQIPGVA